MSRLNVIRSLAAGALMAGTLLGGAPIATAASASVAAPAVETAAAACRPGRAACPIRIRFASGAYTGQATTSLAGHASTAWFVVKARARQAMIVIVKGAGPTRGSVYFPNGGRNGQPGGRVFDDLLPVSGDYRIEVTESAMGEGWSGKVTVVVVAY